MQLKLQVIKVKLQADLEMIQVCLSLFDHHTWSTSYGRRVKGSCQKPLSIDDCSCEAPSFYPLCL